VIGVLIFLFDRGDDQIPPSAFLRDIASRAALAIDNSTLYESRRREVVTMQQHLLPTRLPTVDGLALAASYTVGDQVLEVGGDFYDVVVRADGTVAATIGDVCGRGVDAAALTGMARHTLAALLQEGMSPSRAMNRLNARLRLDGSWRFITAGVALIRPAAGGFAVDWTSAGHPAPVVLRRGRPARPGRGGGVPLGILPEPSLGRSRLRLGAGDTLVIFTDGLTESRDAAGRMFEEQAFGETLDLLRDAPVDALVHELSLASARFGGANADDIAILAIRADPGEGDNRDGTGR
jgi:serine phosphatase RsbU (regulator of sigma subunit)